eukprot:1615993-Pyramimonas_sp.AAC.1
MCRGTSAPTAFPPVATGFGKPEGNSTYPHPGGYVGSRGQGHESGDGDRDHVSEMSLDNVMRVALH